MELIPAIGDGPLALDTVVFVYFIEEHPSYLPLPDRVFAAIDKKRPPAIASSLTLLEVLVVPYRAGNIPLAELYERVLTQSWPASGRCRSNEILSPLGGGAWARSPVRTGNR